MLSALAGLLLIVVFFYLFRATLARGGGVPSWFVYLVIGAPILYAASTIAGAFEAIDLADEFASGEPIRGKRGEDRATDLSGTAPVLVALATAGTVGVAFLFVMLPLRARRVGLLSAVHGHPRRDRGRPRGVPAHGRLVRDPGVLARRARDALPRQLAGRARAGLGERRGRAVADRGAAARPRADAGQEEEPTLDPTPPEPEPVPERPASRKRRRRSPERPRPRR